MAPRPTRKQAVMSKLEVEGWSVFNTRKELPGIFCVRDGKIMFVQTPEDTKFDDSEVARSVLQQLEKMGIEVERSKKPPNPGRNGKRIVRSVSYRPVDIPFYHKLRQILRIEHKKYSDWAREMTIAYVREKLGTAVF